MRRRDSVPMAIRFQCPWTTTLLMALACRQRLMWGSQCRTSTRLFLSGLQAQVECNLRKSRNQQQKALVGRCHLNSLRKLFRETKADLDSDQTIPMEGLGQLQGLETRLPRQGMTTKSSIIKGCPTLTVSHSSPLCLMWATTGLETLWIVIWMRMRKDYLSCTLSLDWERPLQKESCLHSLRDTCRNYNSISTNWATLLVNHNDRWRQGCPRRPLKSLLGTLRVGNRVTEESWGCARDSINRWGERWERVTHLRPRMRPWTTF